MSEIEAQELPDFGYAFLEPRCLFDEAISSLELSMKSSKIYYKASRVEEICLKHYGERVWNKLLTRLQDIKEVIELI